MLTTFTATANTAAVQGNQLYGPYGNSRYSQGSMGTNKGFTGHYADATGLDYYNARYYDPVVGRFLSADVVQGDLQGMDPYDYVGGNPETVTDPTGQRYIQNTGGGDPVSDPGSGGGVSGGACKSYICYGAGGQAVPKPNAGPPVTPYSPPSHPAKPRPPARPHHAGPSVSQVTAALQQVAGLAGQLVWEAIDLVFNFSGMWHDIQTLTDPNAGWWDKFKAGVDLGATIFTDINMLDGEGETARAAEVGAEIAEKGVADVADKGLSDAVGDVADCALSFSPRTPVATDHGKQAIVSLHPGDKVWAYNPQTGKMELQPILHVWINHDNDLVDLTITTQARPPLKAGQQSEVVHTTQKHPFLTVEKGFLPVGQIKLGMHVLRADGSIGTITGWKVVPGLATMYNLEVAQDHTYTVGDGLWIVHNCGEIITHHPDAQSAFDQVTKQVGDLSGNGQLTQAKGLGGDSAVSGLDNGLKDGRRSWRLDYDPEKGPHFNWQAGKKSGGGRWGAATFPGTHSDYVDMLLRFGEGGVEAMLGP